MISVWIDATIARLSFINERAQFVELERATTREKTRPYMAEFQSDTHNQLHFVFFRSFIYDFATRNKYSLVQSPRFFPSSEIVELPKIVTSPNS